MGKRGAFFEGSNLLISTIIKFIYNWAYEILDYKLAKREFNMGTHAFVDWKSFLRDICAEHFIRHPLRIGGPGVTVEIDESVFMWRLSKGNDPFHNIIAGIRENYPQ